MAAACRIHVDLATQRPDAEFLGGEALAIDTPIPTPDGWIMMADLDVGQFVFDEHGQPTRVVATTQVQSDRPCYRVTFSDHSSIVADENHLWTVTSESQRLRYSTLTRSERYPQHSELARQVRDLPARDAEVTVQELEAEVGRGRLDLLRRGINDGRWNLVPTEIRPGLKGRTPPACTDGRISSRLYPPSCCRRRPAGAASRRP